MFSRQELETRLEYYSKLYTAIESKPGWSRQLLMIQDSINDVKADLEYFYKKELNKEEEVFLTSYLP